MSAEDLRQRIADAIGQAPDARAVERALSLFAEVRAERDAFADRLDTLTAVAKGNKRAYAEAVATVARLEARRVELERIANAERERAAELEKQTAAVRAFAVSHEYRWLLELLDGPGSHGGAL